MNNNQDENTIDMQQTDLNKQIEDLKSQLERQNEPHQNGTEEVIDITCVSLTKEDEPPTSNDRHRLRVIEADVSSLDEDHTVVLDAETEDIIASISEHEMQNLRQSLVDDADSKSQCSDIVETQPMLSQETIPNHGRIATVEQSD
eukprot:657909_1